MSLCYGWRKEKAIVEKNGKSIVSFVVVAIILVVIGKFIYSQNVYDVILSDKFLNIEWGDTEEQAREKIKLAGYNLLERKLVAN